MGRWSLAWLMRYATTSCVYMGISKVGTLTIIFTESDTSTLLVCMYIQLHSMGAHLVHLRRCTVWVASGTSRTLFSLLLCVAQREDSLSSSVDGTIPQDAALETLLSSDFGRQGSTRPPPTQHSTCLHNTRLHSLITAHISMQRSPHYKQDIAGAALWGFFFGQCLCGCL